MSKKGHEILNFKDKPLVRSGDIIYYGEMTDPFIAVMQVTQSEKFEDLELPSRVSVQIFSTDESLPLIKRIKKGAEKKSLYEAINIASIWLARFLENGESED